MANIDQTEAGALLAASLKSTAYATPPGQFIALATSSPTATTPGTEVTGGSYARQAVTFGTVTAGACSNTGVVSFTNMPAATVTSIDIWSTSTGTTRRLWYGALAASKTTASGDTLSFAVGAVTASLG